MIDYLLHRGTSIIILVLLIILTIIKFIQLFGKKELTNSQLSFGIGLIPYLGALFVIIRYIVSYRGIALAIRDIAQANDISREIVLEGFKVWEKSLFFIELPVLVLSGLIWLVLKWKYKKVIND